LHRRRRGRPDSEAGDQLGGGFVIAHDGLISPSGRECRESGYPGADLMRGIAAFVSDERVGPVVQLSQLPRVDDLEESLVPHRVERLEFAFPVGQAPGRVNHRHLPRQPLFRGHRPAMHDPFRHRRRRSFQGRDRWIM
jgi:hypothetical protein